jgi:alpha-1,6-mannosyltransferase
MDRLRAAPRFPREHLWLFAGLTMAVCFTAIIPLGPLRGPTLNRFLPLFLGASAAYAVAVYELGQSCISLRGIWVLAILFRLLLLPTGPPTLSDDVYRYIWDGRLLAHGVNPYAQRVNSPALDPLDSPQRELVNNDWMASPYLPVAQALFGLVYGLVPDNTFAFQVAAVILDLLTGWLVIDLLKRLGLPQQAALIYLWNPLVIVASAHGAHIDAMMLFLLMGSLWSLVALQRSRPPRDPDGPPVKGASFAPWKQMVSPLLLAGATLTKGIPALLLPVLAWRWGFRRMLLYLLVTIAILLPFGLDAGWGLSAPTRLNPGIESSSQANIGEGLFGALRIYADRWNYNGGLYHWLEITLSGYRTPGAVPPEIVGEGPVRAAKLIVGTLLGLVLAGVAWKAREVRGDATLVRLCAVPLAAYLLLTTTVHPWYVSAILPLLPFWVQRENGLVRCHRFIWPWLYFGAAVSLSYLTYLDPANLREYDWVRLSEYLPLYALLIWSAWPASGDVGSPAAD